MRVLNLWEMYFGVEKMVMSAARGFLTTKTLEIDLKGTGGQNLNGGGNMYNIGSIRGWHGRPRACREHADH